MSKESAVPCEPDDAGGNAPAPEDSPRSSSSSRSPRGLIVALRARPRRATLFVALSAVAVVGLVAVGLAYRPNAGGVVIAGPSSVVFGSDGIPTQIDGQSVYRVGEKAEWQNLGGSFLLTGYPIFVSVPCPMFQQPPAEADLLGNNCDWSELAPKTQVEGGRFGEGIVSLAPRGSGAVFGWDGGRPIVVRVHSHDPEAASCDVSALCIAAIVVEVVVWPVVPTEIDGQRVYRRTDYPFPTSGSFLVGGLFLKPVEPPCPAPSGKSEAERRLIDGCYIVTIDGLFVTPLSTTDEPKDEIVVARVHFNDPLAAQCPADVRANCQGAKVVESVVWRSNPYTTTFPTPGRT